MMRNLVSVLLLTVTSVLVVACKKEAGKSCGNENEAVCEGSAVLTCTKGTWVKSECRGPKGCAVNQNFVECDHTLATLGDVCDHEEGIACAVDGKALLKCANGKFAVDEACTGETTCKVIGSQAGCR